MPCSFSTCISLSLLLFLSLFLSLSPTLTFNIIITYHHVIGYWRISMIPKAILPIKSSLKMSPDTPRQACSLITEPGVIQVFSSSKRRKVQYVQIANCWGLSGHILNSLYVTISSFFTYRTFSHWNILHPLVFTRI